MATSDVKERIANGMKRRDVFKLIPEGPSRILDIGDGVLLLRLRENTASKWSRIPMRRWKDNFTETGACIWVRPILIRPNARYWQTVFSLLHSAPHAIDGHFNECHIRWYTPKPMIGMALPADDCCTYPGHPTRFTSGSARCTVR